MSKYIIELDDRIKLVTSVGVTEHGVVYTTSDYVHNLEELNSDYINEHFGVLQDEAYQRGYKDCETRYCSFDACPNRQAEYKRGLEDGKAQSEKGCVGCMWEDKDYNTCSICCNSYKNMYEAKKTDEEIDEKITSFLDCNGYTIDEVFNRLKRMKGEE